MICYSVRYRVSYADGDSSPIKVTEIMADTPDEASEQVTRLEFQCPDRPIRSVNIRAVEIFKDPRAEGTPIGSPGR